VSTLSPDERAELEALRARVAELERERAAEIERASAAVAEAQQRAYWLDRWHIDLNALMERPGAAELRAAVRVVRWVLRRVKALKRRILA
jgi:hypothetical protein